MAYTDEQKRTILEMYIECDKNAVETQKRLSMPESQYSKLYPGLSVPKLESIRKYVKEAGIPTGPPGRLRTNSKSDDKNDSPKHVQTNSKDYEDAEAEQGLECILGLDSSRRKLRWIGRYS